jgi:hypothetical protein
MDHMDYGLSEPQLALMGDGGVFVAGQIQAPMEAPAIPQTMRWDAQAGVFRSVSSNTAGTVLTSGMCLWGTIPGRWDGLGYPEEAALRFDGANLVAETINTPPGVLDPLAPPSRPTKARISIPLPINADLSSSTTLTPLTSAVNSRDRYYLFKIRKPIGNYLITGVKVKVQAGNSWQYVLGGPSSWQGIATGVFWQVRQQSDIPVLSGTDEESVRENLRKAWARQWLPVTARPFILDEFYKIRVTFAEENAAAISYGLVGGQIYSPPSDNLNYAFQIQYSDRNGRIGTWDIPAERARPTNLRIVAHWNAAQFFTHQWFPSWNDDKWCSLPMYTWLRDETNRQALGPVNDITLEHGRNTGHHAEHLRGDALDIFHPGFSALIGGVGADGKPSESGDTFMNNRVCVLLASAKAGDAGARANLVSWISQARIDLQHMLERMNDSRGNFVGSGLYLRSTGDAQYVDVRSLLWTGQCTNLNLTQDTINGANLGPWIWVGGDRQMAAITPDNSGNVHTTHIHIRPQGRLDNQ